MSQVWSRLYSFFKKSISVITLNRISRYIERTSMRDDCSFERRWPRKKNAKHRTSSFAPSSVLNIHYMRFCFSLFSCCNCFTWPLIRPLSNVFRMSSDGRRSGSRSLRTCVSKGHGSEFGFLSGCWGRSKFICSTFRYQKVLKLPLLKGIDWRGDRKYASLVIIQYFIWNKSWNNLRNIFKQRCWKLWRNYRNRFQTKSS